MDGKLDAGEFEHLSMPRRWRRYAPTRWRRATRGVQNNMVWAKIGRPAAGDPPATKWSDLRYVFDIRAAIRRGAATHQGHPTHFGERPVLKLMFAALIRAAESWRGLRMTEFEHRQLTAIRSELNRAHAARTAPVVSANVTASPARLSSKNRT